MANSGKPNPLAPAEEKEKKAYGLAFGKYIQGKAIGSDFSYYQQRRDRIRQARAYAQGDQDNTRYKQLFNATGDESPLNLDWTPLGIGSKFMSSLISDIVGDDFYFNVKAVDPASNGKRRQERDRLLGEIYGRESLKMLEKASGVSLLDENNTLETEEEVDLHMDINYKQSVEISSKQIIQFILELNKYPADVRQNVAFDLVTAGQAGVRVWFDPSYGIRVEYIDAEFLVHSEAGKPNMQELEWAGQVKWMSIGDVRRLSKGDIPEDELEKMAKEFKGRFGNDKFYQDYQSNYNNSNKGYYQDFMYDSLVVPVLNFAFKTVNEEKIKITKSKYGERRYVKRDTYKPKEGSKNVSVESDYYECVYEGSYILGTDHVFGYGKMKNMVRPEGSLSKVELPYKVFAPKFYNMTNKSLMEIVIPMIDQINIAYLNMQKTLAKAKTHLTVIDIEGWLNISMAGKDFTPLDLQDIMDANNIVYTKSRGEDGQFIPNPVQHFATPVNIEPFINVINFNIQLLREHLGFTPEREGVTKAKQLVGVMELSIQSSRNSTKFIEDALNRITIDACNDIMWRVQDTPKGSKFWKIYEEAIGSADIKVIKSMDEIPMANLGIFINTKPTTQQMLALDRDIERSITQKELRVEDSMMIHKLAQSAGIDTAYQYMVIRRKKYQKELMQQQEAMKMAEQQRQIMIQQAAAQAKQMEQQGEIALAQAKAAAEGDKEVAVSEIKHDLELEKMRIEHIYKMELAGVEGAGQMGKEKMKEDRKDDRVKLQGKITAKQQEEVAKVKDGRKPTVNTEEIETEETDIEKLL